MTAQDIYTHVTLVVDRSGSMGSAKEEANAGIKKFIKNQKKESGKMTLTIIQFDAEIETVVDFTPIEDVSSYVLVPRGMTALYDAIGFAVKETAKIIDAAMILDKPDNVLIAIMTDGFENASKKFTIDKIKKLIKKKEKADWEFAFLGAGLTAQQGIQMGVSNSTSYDPAKTGETYSVLSGQTSLLRAGEKFDMPDEVK